MSVMSLISGWSALLFVLNISSTDGRQSDWKNGLNANSNELQLSSEASQLQCYNPIDTSIQNSAPVFHGCDPEASQQEILNCFQMKLLTYVSGHLDSIYAALDALERLEERKIFIEFTIDENGVFGEGKTIRPILPKVDEVVMRLLTRIPPCNRPPIKDGKFVKMSFTLPLNIRIE